MLFPMQLSKMKQEYNISVEDFSFECFFQKRGINYQRECHIINNSLVNYLSF